MEPPVRPPRTRTLSCHSVVRGVRMRLLVLGGTRFVGRAVITAALERGWEVTALHRGITGAAPAGVTKLHADRTDIGALEAALQGGSWEGVVDTWSGAPAVATAAAGLLADRADHFCYVSSGSVYEWGAHRNKTSPVIDGDPDGDDGDYPH